MKRSRFTDQQIAFALQQAEQGTQVASAFPLAHHYRRCWPGALKLPSQIASGYRGIDLPEIWGKLTFRPNLCYFSTCEKNWLREEDR
jgi:hypothetical protein